MNLIIVISISRINSMEKVEFEKELFYLEAVEDYFKIIYCFSEVNEGVGLEEFLFKYEKIEDILTEQQIDSNYLNIESS